MRPEDFLRVSVRYIAADHPYKNDEVSRSETVGWLKGQVLQAFGLQEGSAGQGAVVFYELYEEKKPLTDLTATLGSIAGYREALDLKLSQEVHQG